MKNEVVHAVPKPARTVLDKPVWKHNCQQCVFLGHIHGYDLYFCTFENLPVITARYNDLADGFYRDHVDAVHWKLPLKQAAKLAKQKGLA